MKKTNFPVGSTVAISDDQTIQINFSIPEKLVLSEENEVIKEISKSASIKGFRKGHAPVEKVREKLDKRELIEKVLARILPQAFAEAIVKHKIRPAMYPKFELVNNPEKDKNLLVKALTCQIKDFDLGDYKKIVKDILLAPSIIVPEKTVSIKDIKNVKTSTDSKEVKEDKILKALLENIKIDLPSMLKKEEADARLASLLERLEKLGLSLENYLASIGKDEKSLRDEYEKVAENTIKLDLILTKIADQEKIAISKEEIDSAIKSLGEKAQDSDRRMIELILKKRAVVESLIKLV